MTSETHPRGVCPKKCPYFRDDLIFFLFKYDLSYIITNPNHLDTSRRTSLAVKKKKKKLKKLEAMALLFVLNHKGQWSESSQERFANRVMQKGLTNDACQIQASLERAKRQLDQGFAHLFVCCGSSCKKDHKLKLNKKNRELFRETYGLHITKTKCQGPCKKSPVSTLRIGGHYERLFNKIRKKEDLETLAQSIQSQKNEEVST